MARLEQLQSMLADSPQDGFLLFALAKEHEKAGDDDNALHYYKSLELIDPTYVGLYYHLAKLYERRNEIETAFHSYTTGMKVAKEAGDDHAYRELAGARLEIGDEDDF